MQFQICNSGEVWISIGPAEAKRIVHKRTGALAKMIRDQRKFVNQEAREYRRAEQGVQNELREAERGNRALWKQIRVKPGARALNAIERKPHVHRPVRSGWLAEASQLPSYSGRIVDRMGRAGIFFRVRYYGSTTKSGVGRRSTIYIWNGAYVSDNGEAMFASNVGETIEEAAAALEAVELFNREAQAGAKVLFHAIANVPYQLLETSAGVDGMFEIGRRFAEQQFGNRDLPFAIALHPPSEEGDQRNWHLHLIFSTRSLVRTDDHEWDIGRIMRREIDNPAEFEEMRHLYARIQTEVVQEAGLNLTFTALSNVERGLPNAPQKHLGSARTARVRRGEGDEVNEQNWVKMLAGEAALMDERLRRNQEQAAAEQALFERFQDQTAPFVANLSAGPPLALATLQAVAEPIANFPDGAWARGSNHLAHVAALPVANLQLGNRIIADVSPLKEALHSDTRNTPHILLEFPAVQSNVGPIEVPTGINERTRVVSSSLSLSTLKTRQHRIAQTPLVSADVSSPEVLPPQLGVAGPTAVEPVISEPPSWGLEQSVGRTAELSLCAIDLVSERPLEVPKQMSAMADTIIDSDIGEIFRLLDARWAQMEERKRARKERAAKQREKVEQSRKAEEEQRVSAEAEQQRFVTEQSVALQTERDAAKAFDQMLNTIEVERSFVNDDGDRWVIDDAIIKRFGVASAVIASVRAQLKLDVVADRQRAEIEPMIAYLSANPGQIVRGARGWTLSSDAPDPLRRIADAWVHEPQLQQAIAQAATVYRATTAKAEPIPSRVPIPTAAHRSGRIELLIRAAQQRSALTARWQKSRRFDQSTPTSQHQTQVGVSPTEAKAHFRRPVNLNPDQGR